MTKKSPLDHVVGVESVHLRLKSGTPTDKRTLETIAKYYADRLAEVEGVERPDEISMNVGGLTITMKP